MIPLVLAIEPDPRQAALIKQVVCTEVGVELVLVESRDEAIAAIRRRVPDLILVTALLSPRDGAELDACLRRLEHASHLQMLTIPVLALPDKTKRGRSGLGLLKRAQPTTTAGCHPAVFAEEVRNYLSRACEAQEQTAAREASKRRREASKPAGTKSGEKRPKRAKPADAPIRTEPVAAQEPAPSVTAEPSAIEFHGPAALPGVTLEEIGRALVEAPTPVQQPRRFFGMAGLTFASEELASVRGSLAAVARAWRHPVIAGLTSLDHDARLSYQRSVAHVMNAWRRPAIGGLSSLPPAATAKILDSFDSIHREWRQRSIAGLALAPPQTIESVRLSLVSAIARWNQSVVYGLASIQTAGLHAIRNSWAAEASAWKRPAFVGLAMASPTVLAATASALIEQRHQSVVVPALAELPVSRLNPVAQSLATGAEQSATAIAGELLAGEESRDREPPAPSQPPAVDVAWIARAITELQQEVQSTNGLRRQPDPPPSAQLNAPEGTSRLFVGLPTLAPGQPETSATPPPEPKRPRQRAAVPPKPRTSGRRTGKKVGAGSRAPTTTGGVAARAPAAKKRRTAPLAIWARQVASRSPAETAPADDVRALLSELEVPANVLSVTYPRGCRIQHVRVAKVRRRKRRKNQEEPLIILSRKLLEELHLGKALRSSTSKRGPLKPEVCAA